jgi:hypothetical protein
MSAFGGKADITQPFTDLCLNSHRASSTNLV